MRRAQPDVGVGELEIQVPTVALTQGGLDDPLLGVGDIRD
jgi:hypothetical protein